MSLGQLFIAGFEGTTISPEAKAALEKLQPAGIILYDSNIESREQVRSLIKDLKELLGKDLIVTVDQEGGKVERLRKVCTSVPSFRAVGKLSEKLIQEAKDSEAKELIYSHTKALAYELLGLGFNLALAPCADLYSNPKNPIIGSRSLGNDPKIVSQQIEMILEAYKECGLATCTKHFPGHGDTSLDSHLDLPIIEYDLDEYEKHLEPFKAAIKSYTDSIMVAHVAFPEIEKKHNSSQKEIIPATMSKAISRNELRESLGFQGLVVSDEMTMKGISKLGSPGEISQKVIEAGSDIMLWNTNIEVTLEALDFLKSSSLDEEALKRALKNIADFKAKLDKTAGFTNSEQGSLETKMVDIAKEAIDWNCSREKLSSINGNTAILCFDHPKLETEMIKAESGLEIYKFSESKDAEDSLKELEAKLKNHESLIILSFQACNHPKQKNFIDLIKNSKQWKTLHCSTDTEDSGSDCDLHGANKAHIKALLSYLP